MTTDIHSQIFVSNSVFMTKSTELQISMTKQGVRIEYRIQNRIYSNSLD